MLRRTLSSLLGSSLILAAPGAGCYGAVGRQTLGGNAQPIVTGLSLPIVSDAFVFNDTSFGYDSGMALPTALVGGYDLPGQASQEAAVHRAVTIDRPLTELNVEYSAPIIATPTGDNGQLTNLDPTHNAVGSAGNPQDSQEPSLVDRFVAYAARNFAADGTPQDQAIERLYVNPRAINSPTDAKIDNGALTAKAPESTLTPPDGALSSRPLRAKQNPGRVSRVSHLFQTGSLFLATALAGVTLLGHTPAVHGQPPYKDVVQDYKFGPLFEGKTARYAHVTSANFRDRFEARLIQLQIEHERELKSGEALSPDEERRAREKIEAAIQAFLPALDEFIRAFEALQAKKGEMPRDCAYCTAVIQSPILSRVGLPWAIRTVIPEPEYWGGYISLHTMPIIRFGDVETIADMTGSQFQPDIKGGLGVVFMPARDVQELNKNPNKGSRFPQYGLEHAVYGTWNSDSATVIDGRTGRVLASFKGFKPVFLRGAIGFDPATGKLTADFIRLQGRPGPSVGLALKDGKSDLRGVKIFKEPGSVDNSETVSPRWKQWDPADSGKEAFIWWDEVEGVAVTKDGNGFLARVTFLDGHEEDYHFDDQGRWQPSNGQTDWTAWLIGSGLALALLGASGYAARNYFRRERRK